MGLLCVVRNTHHIHVLMGSQDGRNAFRDDGMFGGKKNTNTHEADSVAVQYSACCDMKIEFFLKPWPRASLFRHAVDGV
jgi:hypothetical protein